MAFNFGEMGQKLGGGRSSYQGFKEKVPKGYEIGSVQQFTPEQMDLYQQMFGHLGPDSYLSRLAGGDQSQFEEMERPAMRQFNELQGGIASRFSQGGTGGRRSSGFQNTMSSAASNFAQDLQSKRLDMRNQALKDLMGYSHQLMGERPYQRDLFEKPQGNGPLGGFGGAIGAGLGGVGGFFLGGPGGALAGATLGNKVGQGL